MGNKGYMSWDEIIDISNAPNSVEIVYDSNDIITRAHNIFIDEKLYPYLIRSKSFLHDWGPVVASLADKLNNNTKNNNGGKEKMPKFSADWANSMGNSICKSLGFETNSTETNIISGEKHKKYANTIKLDGNNNRGFNYSRKAMSKLTGGLSDVYLTQSELNGDGSYTIFFVSIFTVGFDTELTQFGLENPTSKISSFHLKDEKMFNRLQELMVIGYKEFKAHTVLQLSLIHI